VKYGIFILIACFIAIAVPVAANASPTTGACGDDSCSGGYDPTYGDGYSFYVDNPDGVDYASGNCRTKTAGIQRVNWFGWTMWRYRQQVQWCWSGGVITYINRYRYPSDMTYTWQFNGHVANSCGAENCSDMAGRYSAFLATTGSFSYCSFTWGIGCFETILPRVNQTITAGGGYAVTVGA
jgi:hypothetical protein